LRAQASQGLSSNYLIEDITGKFTPQEVKSFQAYPRN
jgi:hypothetical protein